jgi:mannosyltransferase OCH1-like enzyme
MQLLISFTPQLVSTFVLFPISGTPTLNVDSRFTPEAIAALKEQPQSNDSAIVPRIIHQVKLGGLKMKPTWTAARQSCLETHPQWEFKLWEDKEGDEFVKAHYPQIFDHYRGYKLGELHSLRSSTRLLANVRLLRSFQRSNEPTYSATSCSITTEACTWTSTSDACSH